MFLKNSLLSIAINVLQIIGSLGATIIISRELGVTGKGQVYLISQIISFLTLILSVGFGPSLIYCIKNNILSKAEANIFNIFYIGLSGFLIFLLAYYFPQEINNIFGSSFEKTALEIALSITFFNVISNLFGYVLLSSERGVKVNLVISLATNVIYLTGICLVLIPSLANFNFVISVLFFTSVTKALLTIGMNLRGNSTFAFPMFHKMHSLTSNSLSFFLNAFLFNSVLRIDTFFLSNYSTIDQIGYYSVSANIAELVFVIPSAIGAILFPYILGTETFMQKTLMSQTARYNFLLCLLTTITIGAIGYPLIYFIFGAQFLPAYMPLIFLLPGVFAMALNYSYSNYVSATGRVSIGTLFYGVGLTLNLLLNYLFIPKYGMYAAAINSTCSYITITFLFVFYIMKKEAIKLTEITIIKYSDIAYLYTRLKILKRSL